MNLTKLFLSITLLFISISSFAQIPDVSENCPAYSCVMYMDTNKYYPIGFTLIQVYI